MATTKPATITRDQLEALLDARQEQLTAQIETMIAEAIGLALEPIRDALAERVKYGDPIALKAASGQVVCAEQGGPATERETFVLTSRSSIGPWESWECLRGA